MKNQNQPSKPTHFSKRQIQIAELMSKGATNNWMAFILRISPHTVHSHIKFMLKKLRVKTRIEIVVYMLKNNIIKSIIVLLHFVGSDFFEVSSEVAEETMKF